MNISARVRNIGICIFLLVSVFAISARAYRVYFWGGQVFEFCQYAEIGRHILEGHGFSTSSYFPLNLAYFDSRGVPAKPHGIIIFRFPLQCLWMAIFESLFGKRDLSVVAANVVAHGLWVVGIFFLGQMFFSWRVSFAAAFLWAVNPMMIAGYDQMGYADVMFGFVFLVLNCLFCVSISRPSDSSSNDWLLDFALGCLAGLAYLCRFSSVLWLPFYLILLLRSRGLKEGKTACAAFLAGAAVFVIPWTAYYTSHVGFSFPPGILFQMADGVLVKGMSWIEYTNYSISDFASVEAVLKLGAKWLLYISRFLGDFPTYWDIWLAFPLAAVWFFTKASGPARTFAGLYAALLLWQAFFFSFMRYETLGFLTGRYYLWSAPVVLLCALEFIESSSAPGAGLAAGKFRAAVWAVFIAANLAVFGWRYSGILPHSDHPSGLAVAEWPELVWIRENTPEDAMFVTNIPTQIAWYCRRRAVNITNTPGKLKTLIRKHPANYIFISKTKTGEFTNYPVWVDLLKGKFGGVPQLGKELGFEVEKVFEEGMLLKSVS